MLPAVARHDGDEPLNYVGGEWRPATGNRTAPIWNGATGAVTTNVRLSGPADVQAAVAAAVAASEAWRRVPANERVQCLFRLKALMEERAEDLARSITIEHGKVLVEARGEVRRALDNIEMACGTPALLQGRFAEDIASGVDEALIRQPVGVCLAIVPFNFPLMIPCWFLPYAIACGNTFILKTSERTPLTAAMLFGLLDDLDLPPGVVNLVHGDSATAEQLIDHADVRAVSFVGSTPAARAVYARAANGGKRAQAQGGAKNSLVVLPDAPIETVAAIAAESAFGNAGQRCLAGGAAIVVGESADDFVDAVAALARGRTLGDGLVQGVELGPVITATSQQRVEDLIGVGADEGARVVVDGRKAQPNGGATGYFVGATVLDRIEPDSTIATTEVFGPVLGITRVPDLDEALRLVNRGSYGNMACLFTENGHAARRFRYEAQAGNIGINVGVAQPMASFPFSGWGDSFFGDLHAHGHHAIEFFTQTKVVVERWP
ncbi:MAG: malonate-semialdehyde dehydrogenase (acetylating) / methylmalonate-semialdehyde dehydrogenase [Acidimicrobiaceae bacterium]|jgi:malonate-semialdehyde dehydrogenase (acetylating)/methylmalonate-semialdehyde dehydrogenase